MNPSAHSPRHFSVVDRNTESEDDLFDEVAGRTRGKIVETSVTGAERASAHPNRSVSRRNGLLAVNVHRRPLRSSFVHSGPNRLPSTAEEGGRRKHRPFGSLSDPRTSFCPSGKDGMAAAIGKCATPRLPGRIFRCSNRRDV